MDLLHSLPPDVARIVDQWLVPLFILYNIVGWAGLPAREEKRFEPRLSEKDSDKLDKSIRNAWFVGVLVGLAAVTGVIKFCDSLSCSSGLSASEVVAVGAVSVFAGLARRLIGDVSRFRNKDPKNRRRVLAGLVICAVTVSTASGVLYYASAAFMHDLIAATYAGIFIGYAATGVMEVGQ
jgi:hypothetical protein